MKKVLRGLLPLIALFPLVIGTIGYAIAGERITDSLYAGVCLYLTSSTSDKYNIYIEIARWTAPLVTATTILRMLQSVWEKLNYRLHLLGKKDGVAVYSDLTCNISFGKGVRAIYPGENFKRYANNHIIMFASDRKNLQFFEKHKEELSGKNVYIGIRDIECGLLDIIDNTIIFDVNGTIARLLWKDIALWNRGIEKFDVVILGDSKLAGDIVSVGLQLNLFSLNQGIKYHFITENKLFQCRHSDMRLMNDDKIIFYDKNHPDIWRTISDADIVIIADELETEWMQTIVVKAGETPIYYYSPEASDFVSHFSSYELVPFGRNEVVFTDDNIRRKKTLSKAIALNEYYANKYGTEKEWDLLTGFLQLSNISASDFGEVLSVLSKNINENDLAQLEHIRWCRFHYLNYYKPGIPENGSNKDAKKRIHKDLVDYEELEPSEQIKDVEAVRNILGLYESSGHLGF